MHPGEAREREVQTETHCGWNSREGISVRVRASGWRAGECARAAPPRGEGRWDFHRAAAGLVSLDAVGGAGEPSPAVGVGPAVGGTPATREPRMPAACAQTCLLPAPRRVWKPPLGDWRAALPPTALLPFAGGWRGCRWLRSTGLRGVGCPTPDGVREGDPLVLLALRLASWWKALPL